MPWLPAMDDVLRARRVIAPHLPRTPLIQLPGLSERLGFDLWLKAELTLPTGSFKVRGGLNFMSQLPPEMARNGVVTASTGNHGQSIAYAARANGVRATIYVPEAANPLKVASMRRMGADVRLEGADFFAACEAMDQFAVSTGAYRVHPANEPPIIAGVATYALEIFEDLPAVDAIFVAVGGGSGLSGVSLVSNAVKPRTRVFGAQSTGAPAAYESWKARELKKLDRMETFAEGIATREAFDLPARLFWDKVEEIVLVADTDIKQSMLTTLEQGRIVAEGAGAAALAAAIARRDQLQGSTVVCVASGGNVTMEQLRQIMNEEQPW
ncbi:MAG: pyridoxal-phosphate dependent enzyme [Thermomicrobiales bacterium]|nr:pyridoxal-phosphate dependent enzyme [Thermomicrobiales bacterium]